MEIIKESVKKKSKKYTINIVVILVVAFSFTAYTLFTDDNLGLVIQAFSEANFEHHVSLVGQPRCVLQVA
jgi:hypothetical protein